MIGAVSPDVFTALLAELESNRLEVALVPAPRPRHECHAVRVAVSKNPAWYRRLCAAFPSSRRRSRSLPDTRIRRASVVSLLSRLASGAPVRSRYAEHLARIAGQFSGSGVNRSIPRRSATSSPAGEQLSEGSSCWPF